MTHEPYERRYPFLRLVAVAARVFGLLMVAGGVIAIVAIPFLDREGGDGPAWLGGLLGLQAIAAGVLIAATGETWRALVDVEANTRATAEALMRQGRDVL